MGKKGYVVENNENRKYGTVIRKKHKIARPDDGQLHFYSLDRIHSLENELDIKHGESISYFVIFGKRSNGKSFALWKRIVEEFTEYGHQGVYIRRWDDELVRSKGLRAPLSLECDAYGRNQIYEITNGQWDTIVYKDRMFYLAKRNPENKDEPPHVCSVPMCYTMAVSTMEKDKSSGGYQNVSTIFFDEFIPASSRYVNEDEFVQFANCVSTILRTTNDKCRVYLCANAYSPRCKYFYEMGLRNIDSMQPGDVQLYQYGDSGLYVAVEYSDAPAHKTPTQKYFAFGNPKLAIITGDGVWAMDNYPRVPRPFVNDDIVFRCFVEYEGEILEGDVVCTEDCQFLYWHMKTTALRDPDYDLIYSLRPDPRPNWKRSLGDHSCETTAGIARLIADGLCYYSDNSAGDLLAQAWEAM